LPSRRWRGWQSVLVGGALAGVAATVQFAVQDRLGHELPFITFFPALIVASALGGFPGGFSCLLIATLSATLFFAPRNASLPWALGAFWIGGGLVVAVAAALVDSVRELRSSQTKLTEARTLLQTVVGELAHRNRNALFVIMSIVRQSAKEAPSVEAAEQIINARLEALLRAQEVIIQSNSGAAPLRPLLEKALEPFGLKRFDIAPGPDVEVAPDVAVGLGLLFNELATNATKYGALSESEGRVAITWVAEPDFAQLSWREVGGPATKAPLKAGFGSRLFDVALVPQGGNVERRYEPDGLICILRIPTHLAGTTGDASRTPLGARFAALAANAHEPTRLEPPDAGAPEGEGVP
jgi:two-component sensor histidine kinase